VLGKKVLGAADHENSTVRNQAFGVSEERARGAEQ
jgi:hypothetical protein